MTDIFRTVHLKFSDDELATIDAWQVSKSIRTRSEAIRQLIQAGLGVNAPHGQEKPVVGINAELVEFIRQEIARHVKAR